MLAAATAAALIFTLTQSDPGAAAPADTAAPPALSGPRVENPDRPKSLVERDFAGKLKRLEVDPAQAALPLLDLNAEEKAATEKILNERAAIMDTIVTDNLREVVEMSQAFAARDAAAGLRLAGELFRKSGALVDRGRLVDELAGVLTEANAAELHRLTNEYLRAAIEESAQQNGVNGRPRGRQGAVAYERLAGWGNEIRLAFERTIVARGRELEDLLKQLGATPEQESKIRAVIEETYVATFGKPTKAQQTAGFIKIFGLLNDDQRAQLRKRLADQPGLKAANQQNSK